MYNSFRSLSRKRYKRYSPAGLVCFCNRGIASTGFQKVIESGRTQAGAGWPERSRDHL